MSLFVSGFSVKFFQIVWRAPPLIGFAHAGVFSSDSRGVKSRKLFDGGGKKVFKALRAGGGWR